MGQWLRQTLWLLSYLLVRGPTNGLTRSCIKAFEANRIPTRTFSSSKNSIPCKQLFLGSEPASVTGGGMVLFVHATRKGTRSSTVMVVLSKQENMVEKAEEVRACWELTGLLRKEELMSLNSVAYKKVGTMGTENQWGYVRKVKVRGPFTTTKFKSITTMFSLKQKGDS